MRTLNEIALHLEALTDSDWSVVYSPYTSQWFVMAKIEGHGTLPSAATVPASTLQSNALTLYSCDASTWPSSNAPAMPAIKPTAMKAGMRLKKPASPVEEGRPLPSH